MLVYVHVQLFTQSKQPTKSQGLHVAAGHAEIFHFLLANSYSLHQAQTPEKEIKTQQISDR